MEGGGNTTTNNGEAKDADDCIVFPDVQCAFLTGHRDFVPVAMDNTVLGAGSGAAIEAGGQGGGNTLVGARAGAVLDGQAAV